jgi:type II secretory pathway pseudopilin PulG
MTMKKMSKSVLGVTLLEIMLVLAIAAMIIVMSVRYYQSAQVSSQANAFVAQVQAISSAVENLAQGSGGYGSVTSTQVASILPPNGLIAPWGGTITFSPQGTGYKLAVPAASQATCTLIYAKLTASTAYTITDTAACTDLTYIANH